LRPADFTFFSAIAMIDGIKKKLVYRRHHRPRKPRARGKHLAQKARSCST
jgi:hypothetical protein